MLFQREKKQLWRYASSNSPPVSGATINLPQQPPHHQLPHHPQLCQQQLGQPISPNVTPACHQHPAQRNSAMSFSIVDCCRSLSTSSSNSNMTSLSATRMNQQSQLLNIPPLSPPPPPYSSAPYGINCRHAVDDDYANRRQQQLTHQQQPQMKTETSTILGDDSELSVTECDYSKSVGCYYGSYGDTMAVDDYEEAKAPKQQRKQSPPPSKPMPPAHALQSAPSTESTTNSSSSSSSNNSSSSLMMMTTPQAANSFATTAANVFRNCCGAGCLSSIESSTSGSMIMEATTPQQQQMAQTIERATMWATGYNAHSSGHPPTTPATTKQSFLHLMKKMKGRQTTTLFLAVKSFRDPTPPATSCTTTTTTSSANASNSNGGQQMNCILLKRGLIFGEETYVIACRLFFWNDLRGAFELKRLPICTNGRDPVYVCCNPLHWSRILVPETAPPPYQPLRMERLKNQDESSQNGGNSTTASMHSSSSSSGNLKSAIRVQIPESLTTDGEDRRSTVWCEVAYWELAQRVGERYAAEKSTVNIYSEGPRNGCNSAGMCLKDLSDKKCTSSPDSVQKTRQKIGLGVTLSQEADGVWLHNRSAAPIFVHSPTLNECCSHVCKVMPGYCLKAFDKNRAREQSFLCPPQEIGGVQTGPIDRFSMRISFAKGWGSKYSRQDITACPCWLEVLFTRR